MVDRKASSLYTKALRSWSRATDADEQGDFALAAYHYELSCEFFLAYLRLEHRASQRLRVRQNLSDLLARLETVQGLSRSQDSTSQPNSISSAAAAAFDEEGSRTARRGGLKEVAGLAGVKRTLREAVVLPQLQPQVFSGARKPWKGVLLYGPPGTGKSHIAAALSKETGASFISISASDIVSKHLGDSEKAVRLIFEEARSKRPAVIFIDEIDALGRSRDGEGDSGSDASRRLLTELLKQMDGVGTDNDKVTVVAATNHPFDLDAALRRRFEKRVYVPMPGPRARAKILKIHLGDDESLVALRTKDIREFAAGLKGFSGADISNLANEALMIPVRKCLQAKYFRYVPEEAAAAPSLWQGIMSRLSGWFSRGPPQGFVIVPCTSSDPGAFHMNILEDDFPTELLRVPAITKAELMDALTRVKPTVDESELAQYAEFAEKFGSDSRDKSISLEDDELDADEEDDFQAQEEEEEGEERRARANRYTRPTTQTFVNHEGRSAVPS
mmetsp:Transcript_9727/g.19077  ORF Transcript_9727/g.19077 Transcript_9727/m.19077 type:complete len:502 (+) Transcript_9727:92-1597(+)|eukprot:CAMPEP_0171542316 /NCGR_PEP_ID=MMETSP0960-20121227/2286_1 /TAXON_ID=87120 /ORGANISM="Aurantiochytrium limacinum, Strain ATCCMYA-1381" /LENGTH=501 /DNA_ID=CAMNT_0012089817 /DNA_START=102 /DNA_END=1607 /DNA_ORIENTATION=+